MNKKVIDIEKEICELKEKCKNASKALLLININYDDSAINREIEKNIKHIDRIFVN